MKTKDLVLRAIKSLQEKGEQFIYIDDIRKEMLSLEVLDKLNELEMEGKVKQLLNGRWEAT